MPPIRPGARGHAAALRQRPPQRPSSWALLDSPTASCPQAEERASCYEEPAAGAQTAASPSVDSGYDGRYDRCPPLLPSVCGWTSPGEQSLWAVSWRWPQPSCESLRARPLGASPPPCHQRSTPESAWHAIAAGLLVHRAGIKGVKILGRPVDDVLDLTLANAHGGFRFDVMGNLVKGHLGGLGGHPLLQPMRVAMNGQVQLCIPWE